MVVTSGAVEMVDLDEVVEVADAEVDGAGIRSVVVDTPPELELVGASADDEASVMVPKPVSGSVVWLASDWTGELCEAVV